MTVVLACGGHPDDVELGCGGTLAKHVINGDEVHIVVMADGVTSRPGAATADVIKRQEQSYRAAKILGIPKHNVTHLGYPDQRMDSSTLLDIVQVLEEATARIKPQIVYTHFDGDLNLDHQITCRAVKTAFRPQRLCTVQALYSFETPSSTEWAFGDYAFKPNHFVDVDGISIEKKFLALGEYTTELRSWPHPRSMLAIQTLATLRGATIGCQAAEAFQQLWRRA